MAEKKTQIEDISRNIYDIKNKDEYSYKSKKGITKEIVEEISKQKNIILDQYRGKPKTTQEQIKTSITK